MNILVSNDDGIQAAGIHALVEALSKKADVYVSAPAKQQSGKSQSLTLKGRIVVEEVEFPCAKRAFKVDGTPADCTKMGLQLLKDDGIEIDMVFTGINMGSNLGKDTLYSGTVGAAMEAAMVGYQAVAVSVDSHDADQFEYACKLALDVLDKAYKKIPHNVVININTPNLPASEIKGVKHTVLGPKYYDDAFIMIEEGVYELDGSEKPGRDIAKGTDIEANYNKYASITPLTFDYTNFEYANKIKEWTF